MKSGNGIKKWYKQRLAQRVKKARRNKPTHTDDLHTERAYFKTAKSWADDRFTALFVSRHRYQVAFWGMTGLSGLLALCIAVLVPTQHTELVVVHAGPSGYTWLSTTTPREVAPLRWARTQAEIAHYIQLRESYDPLLYAYQTREVKLFSTPDVQAQYAWSQSNTRTSAPINVLGAKGYRTVVVNNVLRLDSSTKSTAARDKHVNLAQADYVVIDHVWGQHQTIKTPYTALVSWQYRGVPRDPSAMLNDWDGFTITKFVVQPINVGQSTDSST